MADKREKLDFDAFLERELFHLYQEAHSDAKKFWSTRKPIDEAKNAIKKMIATNYTPKPPKSGELETAKPTVPGDGEMREKIIDILRSPNNKNIKPYRSIAENMRQEKADAIMQLFASQAAAAQERKKEDCEESYYRGIGHAANDLLRHNRDLTLCQAPPTTEEKVTRLLVYKEGSLTLERLLIEIRQYEDRKRIRYGLPTQPKEPTTKEIEQ